MELFENTESTAESGDDEIPAKQFIKALSDGDRVQSRFLVREANTRTNKKGGEYLRLTLGDSSGTVTAMVWDNVEQFGPHCQEGQVVAVTGRYSNDPRYGPQIVIDQATKVPQEEVDFAEFLEVPEQSVDSLLQTLNTLIDSVADPHLKPLLQQLLLGEGQTANRYVTAPAAKFYHQAFRHGLLEHSVSVAQAVSNVANCFPGINRDLAVSGALLHDIGKTLAYSDDPIKNDFTDIGRLQGEIPLGYYLVRRQIEEIEGFPSRQAACLLHIILAHHGSREMGSPVEPLTREAFLVHMMDNLGGTLGSFDRIEKQLGEGELWSQFDKALNGPAYFGGRS